MMRIRNTTDRLLPLGLALGAVLVFGSHQSEAQTIDRMLAIVEGQVITLGDVRQHRALGLLFGDVVSGADDEVLEDIIENILIENQIRQFVAIEVTEDDVDGELEGIDDYGELPVEVVRIEARARLVRRQFFQQRFQRFNRATRAEIDAYYESVFVPAARAEGLDPIPPLEGQLLVDIERNVTIERTADEVSEWVDGLYRGSAIEVVH